MPKRRSPAGTIKLPDLKFQEHMTNRAWEKLCQCFERVTGESFDAADSLPKYRPLRSWLLVWAEACAVLRRRSSGLQEVQEAYRKVERAAWAAITALIDRIASEQLPQGPEPEAERTPWLLDSIQAWGEEYAILRQAQGEDGIRWGKSTMTYERAKLRQRGLLEEGDEHRDSEDARPTR